MEISITKTTTPKQKPADESKLGFGQYYTDHMFIMNYDEGEGWHNPRIVPYGPFELDPAAMVLHYAQEIFEGMKAYRTADGSIQLFRPDKNMARMNVSCDRLCIPKIDEEFAIKAIKTLVEVDKDWVPSLDGTSLYIRPYIFATDAQVGVHPAKHLTFAIILSPVGAYYPQGIAPVKIFVEQKYVRAVIGGTGFTKAGANYALVGSILGGITRMSIIELLQSKGYKVSERRLSIDELVEAFKAGKLEEAWGTGTAAVISPIGELKYGDLVMPVNNGEIGEVTHMLYDTLTGIQWGKIKDEFGWTVKID